MGSHPRPSPETVAVIAAWSPDRSDAAATFARQVVTIAAPTGAARARTLLWTCSRLAAWGETKGIAAELAALLHPSVIERYTTTGMSELTAGTVRTMRANLRYVARRAAPALQPPVPRECRRDPVRRPYTDAQVAAYFELVRHQATPGRVARLTGLLALTLGAGLTSADLRLVRGTDVHRRSGGVVVEVRGTRARTVPVLERYHDAVLIAAVSAGGGFVIGGEAPNRKNVTSNLLRIFDVGRLDRLEVERLRATWLTEQIERLGLPALIVTAGLSCSSRLVELAGQAPVPEEAVLVTMLGAAVKDRACGAG
ncbi:MAG: hypothetical protein ACRDZR_12995 [Acidimicrobiales bacterium]